jgi:methionyl-tRNA formyltransferase
MVTTAGLRVVFFGTPDFAVPSLDALLASRHQVVAVVTQPDRPRGRGHKTTIGPVKARAEAAGVPVLQPERLKDQLFLDALTAPGADLGVVAAYGKILTDAVLATPRLGMINVHASLLPRHRGAAPVHRAIIAGDTETASRSCVWSRRSTPARCWPRCRARSDRTTPATRSKEIWRRKARRS